MERGEKKNNFDINIGMPVNFYCNLVPIFSKGIRLELFVKRNNEESLFANVTIRNSDNVALPAPIFKIVNVDENIIQNLNVQLNNNLKFVESDVCKSSDKNFKIYKEHGAIRIGRDNHPTDRSMYANARIELKKDFTYVFDLSLNIIFVRNYVNVQSDMYKCNLYCREDNNYLACLVINVLGNHTIEIGDKLMHNTSIDSIKK